MSESKSKLKLTQSCPAEAAILMDANGSIVNWSEGAEELFGWSRRDAVGRLAASLLIPDRLRDQFWEDIQRRVAADGKEPGDQRRIEVTSQHRDGSEFQIDFSVTVLHVKNERYLLGLARDLTAHRQQVSDSSRQVMQSRLEQQTRALTSAADSFEEAVGKCVETLCSITGWPIGFALIPSPTDQKLHTTDIWYIAEEEKLKGLRPEALRFRIRPEKGFVGEIWQSERPVWTSSLGEQDSVLPKPLRKLGLQGALGFPVVVEDEIQSVLVFLTWDAITPDPEMLALINNLRNQLGHSIERRRWIEDRARLAAIVDCSYDAIIGRDEHGRIIAWNTGAEQVYGYTAQEVLGKPSEILLPEGLTKEESSIQDVLRTGRRLKEFETKRRCKNGSIIDVAMTVSPIRDSRGRIVGSSTIERDITQSKRREKELRKAKRDAEKADQAKSEFLANISHELRTPMNAILGMLDLVLGEDLSHEMRDYLSTAHDSANTLLYLLNDLLDFSRMSAGHLELESDPFRLRETLDAAIKTVALRASEKGLELACHVDRNVPNYLKGDGMRLRQVIVNLASNAIKFTHRGEVVVKVNVQSQSEKEVILQFSVRDTGIGISLQDQEKIFAPFTQVDASTTRAETGSGLGLAIVRELVGKMGGSIGVESNPGRGSHFYFSAPFEVLPDQSLQENCRELANLPVLVVDDNHTSQTILEETLVNWSMSPTIVSSAKAALKVYRQAEESGQPFPVLIVDALMPDMDGFMLLETLDQIREGSNTPITVLMLSSADRQTFKQRCQNLQVSAYLEKPVSQSELLDTLMTVLKGPLLDLDSFERVVKTRHSMEILVAEDTPANQKVIRAILEKRGHHVTIANNGREAVDQIHQTSFDVVLMDVQMPTMDGLQATHVIRNLANPSLAEIPIVAMTAHARREDRRKCLAAGMDAYISKPIDASKLIQLIESVERRTTLGPTDTWDGMPLTPEPEADPPQQINIESALARMGGDESLVTDLANFFLEDVPSLYQEIEYGIRDNAANVVARAAHSMKGLAANFDAETLTMAAMALEDHARNEDLLEAKKLLPDLRESIQLVLQELKDYLETRE